MGLKISVGDGLKNTSHILVEHGYIPILLPACSRHTSTDNCEEPTQSKIQCHVNQQTDKPCYIFPFCVCIVISTVRKREKKREKEKKEKEKTRKGKKEKNEKRK